MVDACVEKIGRGKACNDAAPAAQLGGRAAQRVPIWPEASQICNKASSRVLSRLAYEPPTRGDRRANTESGRRFPPACRRLEQGLMLFRYLHRGPNWPTIEALHLKDAA
jgi:hypothetical protein